MFVLVVFFSFSFFGFLGGCHNIPWVVAIKAFAGFALRDPGAGMGFTGKRVDRGLIAVVVVLDDDVDRPRAGVVVWVWGVWVSVCFVHAGRAVVSASGLWRTFLLPRLPIQLCKGQYVGKGWVRTVVVDVNPGTHLVCENFSFPTAFSFFLFSFLKRSGLFLSFCSQLFCRVDGSGGSGMCACSFLAS